MNKSVKYILVGTASFCFFSCSPKLKSILERGVLETNPHLRYESDSLSAFVLYEGYVVNFNKNRRVPNYTIHRLFPEQLKDSNGVRAKRSNNFKIDPRIKSHSAIRADYYQSGYDRGHYVPAGDFVYSQHLKDETFIYTNVSPQLKELNRYGWKYLEAAIRKKVKRCNCEAYVITGTLLKEDSKNIG
ncbi:MAG: DNA/RNA non-specific endonuclease [Flavobacteriales bacterium]|nr:DNA/RNA non-specific endonuclease [Flavobacteriales bacterium]